VTACSDSLVRVFDSRTGQCLMYEEYSDYYPRVFICILLQAS